MLIYVSEILEHSQEFALYNFDTSQIKISLFITEYVAEDCRELLFRREQLVMTFNDGSAFIIFLTVATNCVT